MKTENNNTNNFPPRVESNHTFLVPESFFSKVQESIVHDAKIGRTSKPASIQFLWAAVFSGCLLVIGYAIWSNQHTGEAIALNSDDIAGFMQLDNTCPEIVASHLYEYELSNGEINVDDEAIEDYLIQSQIDINHLTTEP